MTKPAKHHVPEPGEFDYPDDHRSGLVYAPWGPDTTIFPGWGVSFKI